MNKTNSTNPVPTTFPPPDRGLRLTYSLSARVVTVYKDINKKYYEEKKKRQQQQQLESLAAKRSGVNNDGYSDVNWNYIVTDGDTFDDKYTYCHKLGNGSFGQVICAKDKNGGNDVAIKIIKSKKAFYNQAQTEIDLLNLLSEKQTHEDFNCITIKERFIHHNHQCIVFDLMAQNLYELIKSTNFRGISYILARKLAKQILVALAFLARPDIDIIHCDLKPENILLRYPKRSLIRLIDFGSACLRTKRTFTYIQSRFYRSPEVLFGMAYDQKIDIWSFGCVLVELCTGEPLFGGRDQLDQIYRIISSLGMPPLDMIVTATQKQRDMFFERVDRSHELAKYVFQEPATPPDPAEIKIDPRYKVYIPLEDAYFVVKTPQYAPSSRNRNIFKNLHRKVPEIIREKLVSYSAAPSSDYDLKEQTLACNDMVDLVMRTLAWDPSKRISASEALSHPYVVATIQHATQQHNPPPVIDKSIESRTSTENPSPSEDSNHKNMFGKRRVKTDDPTPRIRSRSAPNSGSGTKQQNGEGE